ncbi:hypothetical protein L209DRAFT_739530 [Thermothelomyces heterothallicus CBS 203.75]
MDRTADVHAIPMPSIPFHVYVVSALLVCSLLGSQLLGMWLTGFKKPVVPLNERASQAVAHPCNAHLVSISKDKVPVLDVGHVRSATGDNATLAILGWCGDISVDGSSISRTDCSFEIDRETNIAMFYDKSHSQTSQVFGENAVPFEPGRLRKVVVQKGLNTIIGMGGVGRNLVLFKLDWHYAPDDVPDKVKERRSSCVQDN